jgi:hypothetical protein
MAQVFGKTFSADPQPDGLIYTGDIPGLPPAPAWFEAQQDKVWSTPATNTLYSVRPPIDPSPVRPHERILTAGTGACVNDTGGELILPCNGGHDDYYGNEIYAIAMRDENPTWQRIWGPTPNAQLVTSDINYNALTANLDGSPRTIHGWNSPLFAAGRIWISQNGVANPSGRWSTNTFSISRSDIAVLGDAATWVDHGLAWDPLPGSPGSNFLYQGIKLLHDDVAGRVYVIPEGNVADGTIAYIETAAPYAKGQVTVGTFDHGFSNGFVPTTIANGGVHTRHCMVLMTTQGGLHVLDLDNLAGGWTPPGATGWLSAIPANGPGSQTRYGGLSYHTDSQGAVWWSGPWSGPDQGANFKILRVPVDPLDTAGYSWETITPSNAAVYPTDGGSITENGIHTKFNVIQDMGNGQGALVCMPDVPTSTGSDGPMYAYKLPAGGV